MSYTENIEAVRLLAEERVKKANERYRKNSALNESGGKICKNRPSGSTKSSFDLSEILKDSDALLLIGILLILSSENSDKILIFAIMYILL